MQFRDVTVWFMCSPISHTMPTGTENHVPSRRREGSGSRDGQSRENQGRSSLLLFTEPAALFQYQDSLLKTHSLKENSMS